MIGDKIRQLRTEKCMSLAELARRASRTVSTIHGIESGKNKNPSFRMICDIADVFNVSIEFFK
ncbi:MAG: helix-turn-helix domain-containing protein [Eubacterium sp.]|jgi:transcriptional regulator with XRE-family HTH domain|nr:helix-turn-helix domain-containing protein [Eubacterium sp.]